MEHFKRYFPRNKRLIQWHVTYSLCVHIRPAARVLSEQLFPRTTFLTHMHISMKKALDANSINPGLSTLSAPHFFHMWGASHPAGRLDHPHTTTHVVYVINTRDLASVRRVNAWWFPSLLHLFSPTPLLYTYWWRSFCVCVKTGNTVSYVIRFLVQCSLLEVSSLSREGRILANWS